MPRDDTETVGGLVLHDESTWRNPTRVALRSGDRSYEVETFSETAQKTGNLLRHLGVGEGSTVRITEDRTPESLFGFLGSTLHGATTVFGDEGEGKEDIVVGPTEKVNGIDTERKTLAYGDEPDDTSVVHFEREIWGENPVFPHDEVAGAEQVVLKSDSREFTNREVTELSERVSEEYGIGEGDTVAVRGRLSEPAVVVAGVVSPLVSDATLVLPVGEERCDFGVGSGVPDREEINPEELNG